VTCFACDTHQFAVPMLPHMLCEQLCSLNPGASTPAFTTAFRFSYSPPSPPGVERYAFSTIFKMDREGHVISCWFGRTLINNKCRCVWGGWGGSLCLCVCVRARACVCVNACVYVCACNSCRLDYAAAQGIIDGSITQESQVEERYRCDSSTLIPHFGSLLPCRPAPGVPFSRIIHDVPAPPRPLTSQPLSCIKLTPTPPPTGAAAAIAGAAHARAPHGCRLHQHERA